MFHSCQLRERPTQRSLLTDTALLLIVIVLLGLASAGEPEGGFRDFDAAAQAAVARHMGTQSAAVPARTRDMQLGGLLPATSLDSSRL